MLTYDYLEVHVFQREKDTVLHNAVYCARVAKRKLFVLKAAFVATRTGHRISLALCDSLQVHQYQANNLHSAFSILFAAP